MYKFDLYFNDKNHLNEYKLTPVPRFQHEKHARLLALFEC